MDNSIGRLAESKPDLDNSKIELYSSFKRKLQNIETDGYIELAQIEEKQGSNRYTKKCSKSLL